MRINNDPAISQSHSSAAKLKPASSAPDQNTTFTSILSATNPPPPSVSESSRLAERTQVRQHWLEEANPEVAEELAREYAFNSLSHALLDLSDRPNIRYWATGELVTPKTEAYFSKISIEMQARCQRLYREEVEKGTSPDQILKKIFTFQESMPKAFRDMLAI
jgi:hypothetical protein